MASSSPGDTRLEDLPGIKIAITPEPVSVTALGPPPPLPTNCSRYELTMRASPSVLEAGWYRSKGADQFSLGIRISGYGPLSPSKLFLDLPSEILDPKNPGEAYRNLAVQLSGGATQLKWVKQETFRIDRFGTTLGPVGILGKEFTPTLDPHRLPSVVGEMAHVEWGLPIALNLRVSDCAPEGNYPINAVLTYLDPSSGFRTAKATVEVHVCSWEEKWQRALEILGVGVAVVATIAAVLVLHPM